MSETTSTQPVEATESSTPAAEPSLADEIATASRYLGEDQGEAPPDPESASETQPEGESANEKDVKERARWAALAKKEKRILEQERKYKETLRKMELERQQFQQEREQFESLLKNARNSPENVKQILEKTGLSIDDFARAFLGMPEKELTADELAKEAIKEARELKESLEKEKEETQKQQQERQRQEGLQRDFDKIHKTISENPDKYELIMANNAYETVLREAYSLIQEHQLTITPDQEGELINGVAEIVEANLLAQAKTVSERLKSIKKLGITPHTNTLEDKNVELEPELADAVNQVIRDKKSSKFITNSSTVSQAPQKAVYLNEVDEISEAIKLL
jgi:DNA-binding transcriptional regulator YiaG